MNKLYKMNPLINLKDKFYQLIERIYLSYDNNLVYYDQLTKIHNRNYLDLVVRDKYNHSECDIVIIDTDNFKTVNDNYGHNCGDQILTIIASTLKYLPNAQEVVRYGGDEFLLIVNDQFDYTLFDNLVGMLSYGVYHKSSSESLRSAMKQADYNMYINKNKKKEGDQH